MGASQEKKRRRDVRDSGTDPKLAAQEAERKKQAKSRGKYILGGVIVVLLVALVIVVNSALPYTQLTALTVNGTKYTAADVNFFYKADYYNFCTNYSSYGFIGTTDESALNTSKPLKDQASILSEDGGTWHDYFCDSAVTDLQQDTALCAAAAEAGFEMPEDVKATYDETMASFDTSYESLGYPNLKKYLTALYGKGNTLDSIGKLLYNSYLADAFRQDTYNGFEYTTEEQLAYYEEHRATYDQYKYAYYLVPAADYTDITDEAEALAAAKKFADETAANITDLASFQQLIAAEWESKTVTERSDYASSIGSAYSEWVQDSARKAGDVEVFDAGEDTKGAYIVLYLGFEDNDYAMRSIRNILVKPTDTDADGSISDAEKTEGKAAADAIVEQWNLAGGDEEAFISLVSNSADTTSSANEGLYEHVYKGYISDAVSEFCFESGHKTGDVDVVWDETNSGWQILYYAGESEQTYACYRAETSLRADEYSEWLKALAAEYPTERGYAFRFVG